MEDVFHHNDGTQFLAVRLFVNDLFLSGCFQFGSTQSDTELAVAFRALEHQLFSRLVYGFVKGDVVVTFGAFYSLHAFGGFYGWFMNYKKKPLRHGRGLLCMGLFE
jgi:hypothetical protein